MKEQRGHKTKAMAAIKHLAQELQGIKPRISWEARRDFLMILSGLLN